MNTDRLEALLRDAVTRYARLPFDRFSSLGTEHWFEETGSPTGDRDSSYCQIEVELLDRFVEGGVEVLHIPVIARDEFRELGADLFVYRDGRIRWDKRICEFVDGVPHAIDDRAA